MEDGGERDPGEIRDVDIGDPAGVGPDGDEQVEHGPDRIVESLNPRP